jgi:chromosome segregation ATPase
MPFARRKMIDRVITLRTTVLDERLREAERRLANAETARGELERRLARSESTSASSAAAVSDQRTQVNELADQVTSDIAQAKVDADRRFHMLEELLSAMGQRNREDRRMVDEQLTAIEASMDATTTSIERQLIDLNRRLELQPIAGDQSVLTGSEAMMDQPDVRALRADLGRLAGDLGRISIELRQELARAVDAIRRAPVIDLRQASDTAAPSVDATA